MNATAAVGFDLTSSLNDDTDYAMIDASNEAETCVSKSSVKNANYIQTFKTEKGARLSLIKHLGLKS
jgi:hypothetical protein